MFLNELIKDYITEDIQYECKARLNKEDVLGWLKTIDGFANSKGGVMFVGIEDKTYKIIGFESNEIDKEKLFFYNTIKEHFDILPQINTEIISYIINDRKRYILRINVLESNVKPLIFTYHGLPCIFKRRDGYSSAATTEEIITMSVTNNQVKFDTAISDVKFNFDDFKKLREFYEKYNNEELTIKS